MARHPLAAGVALIAIVGGPVLSEAEVTRDVRRVEGFTAWQISPESLRTPADGGALPVRAATAFLPGGSAAAR